MALAWHRNWIQINLVATTRLNNQTWSLILKSTISYRGKLFPIWFCKTFSLYALLYIFLWKCGLSKAWLLKVWQSMLRLGHSTDSNHASQGLDNSEFILLQPLSTNFQEKIPYRFDKSHNGGLFADQDSGAENFERKMDNICTPVINNAWQSQTNTIRLEMNRLKKLRHWLTTNEPY